MKRKIFQFLVVVLTFFSLSRSSLKLASAAITDKPPYGQQVESWWSSHWANPLSSSYIPLGQIPSPSNNVTLQSGANIQQAVDALPDSGGTIYLDPGTYNGDIKIFSRKNIHIRGKGATPNDVILTGRLYVSGCKEASYGYQPNAYSIFVGGLFQNNPYNIDCALNRKTANIYFYNFTMDGQARSQEQEGTQLANGVVFDKIIWQNVSRDLNDVHSGQANAHVVTDNIWFRGNIFRGTFQTAIYLDGCHACGVVESKIEANFYNSGFVFLQNNDLDYDYNRNGVFEDFELRNGRYIILANNEFVPTSNPSAVTTYDWFANVAIIEASNVLVSNNLVTANAYVMAHIKGACSYHSPVVMTYTDYVFKNNLLTGTVGNNFFEIEHSTQYCSSGGATSYNMSNYTVSNNAVRKTSSGYVFAKEVLGPIGSPKVVSNNCTGASCADPRIIPNNPQPSVSPSPIAPSPTATLKPSISPSAVPTPTPTQACSTASMGDANCDGKIDAADFEIWINNYGQSATGLNSGDFNNDAQVNGIDYVIWLNNVNLNNQSPYPSLIPTATPVGNVNYFPYAIFEDGNNYAWSGKPGYQSDLTKFKANNITDVFYTNVTPYLDVSDSMSVKVVGNPQNILNPQWWQNTTVTENLSTAKQIAQSIINTDSGHPSLIAYNLADDADLYSVNKNSLMVQAFNELLPTVPATVMGPNKGRFEAAHPPIYMTYRYPAMVSNDRCDFNSKQIMSYYANTFGQALQIDRENLGIEDKNVPQWLVLQAHGSTSTVNKNTTDITALRTPSVEELRMQNWISIGEGIDGIGWFIYKTQQFWIGLEDNPASFAEVGDLARRIKPLANVILNLKKSNQQIFSAQASVGLPFANQPYISTLVDKTNQSYFIVIDNSSCSDQNISINSSYTNGAFKDLESGQTYQKGQQIPFRAGDGKIFQVVGTVTPPALTPSSNIVSNGSFENGSGTQISGWQTSGTVVRDTSTAKAGAASMKISSPQGSAYQVAPLSSSLKPNTQYSISYWVKTQGVSGNGIGMRYAHLSPDVGFALTPLYFDSVGGTTDWRHVTQTFYTFAGLTNSRFDLMYEVNGGTAWIDDVIVCEGSIGCNGLYQR